MKAALSKRTTEILEKHDIRICSQEIQGGEAYAELEWYSPEGEDFIFTVWHNGSARGFAQGFGECADDFDPDEHAEMWIENRHTVSGVPQSIRALIDDADAIEKFLGDVAAELERAFPYRSRIGDLAVA